MLILFIFISHVFQLPPHVGLLVAAFTRINEPDSIYGLTLANEVILNHFPLCEDSYFMSSSHA
jgi:hypothetical protein